MDSTTIKYTLIGEIPEEGFYVYELIDPRTSLPFYVGKGRRKRCLAHFCNSELNKSYKSNKIKKILLEGFKIIVKIVLSTLDEEKAFDYEKELITLYGRKNLGRGLLTNVMKGGAGCPSGENNPLYGKPISESNRKHLSEAWTRRKASENYVPYKWSELQRENYNKTQPSSKPLFQICLKTGDVIKEWPSVTAAAKAVGVTEGTLSSQIRRTKYSICSGYIWRFVTDPDVKNGKLLNIDSIQYRRTILGPVKPILQIDAISNRVLREWVSSTEAGNTLGINSKCISKVCNRSKWVNSAGGFKWRKTGSPDVVDGWLCEAPKEQPILGKPIFQISKNLKVIIKEWPNISSASDFLQISASGISNVSCKRVGYNTAGGYIWRFTTDCEFTEWEIPTQ